MALDFNTREATLGFVDKLKPEMCRLKIGKELFTSCGPGIVEELVSRGFDVFLDLKFHDIPNTTAGAVVAAAKLGVWMVNVHVSGGRKMMRECVARLSELKTAGVEVPLLIGVTVLTSMDRHDLEELGLDVGPQEQVKRLAQLAKECGLDGVVCSAQEAQMLKVELGDGFLLVTPGIRPEFATKDDQNRVMTPAEAVSSGVDYMVIGRPITKASEPLKVLQMIQAEIAGK
ncbi:orotidine 5'-phosphate decarboxylase [Oleiphilus messinensis]|uniref:Orotidine 5'-phosphate decarboxylase n=1 Tax=Oleiphilus messinensis TaxID=141451 RepID=A0A1Y0IAF0_9GAMM|nr:orotidine 5'-phosphate decarboxylase [Oleiphilus messinensis]